MHTPYLLASFYYFCGVYVLFVLAPAVGLRPRFAVRCRPCFLHAPVEFPFWGPPWVFGQFSRIQNAKGSKLGAQITESLRILV